MGVEHWSMGGALLSLIGYVWLSHARDVKELRKKVDDHEVRLARHDEHGTMMRSDLADVKACQREIRDLLVSIQVKLGITT